MLDGLGLGFLVSGLLDVKEGVHLQLGIGREHAPEELFHLGVMLSLNLLEIVKVFQRCLVPDILEPLAVKREFGLASVHVGDGCGDSDFGLGFGFLGPAFSSQRMPRSRCQRRSSHPPMTMGTSGTPGSSK